jgi:hypothetical protein
VRDLIGQPATAAHYDRVLRAPFSLRNLHGVRGAVSPEAQALARECFGDLDEIEPPSLTRRAAAGPPDLARFRAVPRFRDAVALEAATATTAHVVFADGRRLVQPMSNPVNSYVGGFRVDRFTRRVELARITRRYPERWAKALPFFQEIDRAFSETLPEVYVRHALRAAAHESITPALSTVAINVNYESRYHYDVGDFKDGFSTLTVVAQGEFDGGLLVFPERRVAVDVRPGDVLFCQSHRELHGNTSIVPLTPGPSGSVSSRISSTVWRRREGERLPPPPRSRPPGLRPRSPSAPGLARGDVRRGSGEGRDPGMGPLQVVPPAHARGREDVARRPLAEARAPGRDVPEGQRRGLVCGLQRPPRGEGEASVSAVQWKNLIARTSLEGLTPRVTLRYADHVWGPAVVVSREVRDAKTGRPEEISAVYNLPPYEWGRSERVLLYLVEQNLAHEAAEFFRVDGEKLFDPHAR